MMKYVTDVIVYETIIVADIITNLILIIMTI